MLPTLSVLWSLVLTGPTVGATKTSKLCQFDLCKRIHRRLVLSVSARAFPDKDKTVVNGFLSGDETEPDKAILYKGDLK